MAFDPVRLKAVRKRWSTALELMLGPATERMLTSAAIGAAMSVLDVAAGAGDQTLRAANRVGPGGRVLATDILDEALQFAATEAHSRGVGNVEFRAMPCERLTGGDASFDAAICRNGLQYLSDLPKGLAEIHRVLKPQSKFAAVVWSAPERNRFLSQSFSIAYRKLQVQPPTPEEPGPFRLGYGTSLRAALEGAQFRDVDVVGVKAPAVFASTSDALEFQQQAMGVLTQLLEDLSDAERAELWREVEGALRAFDHDGSFFADGELLVGSGTK
jgi:SAM-dependent methyltransferase